MLLLVLLLVGLAWGQEALNCRQPGAPADSSLPNLFERVNVTDYCADFCAWNQYNLREAMICQDGGGWSAQHVNMPMAVYLWSGSAALAVIANYGSETFEAVWIGVLGFDSGTESIAGILIFDVGQGLLGLLLGWLLLRAFRGRPLWPRRSLWLAAVHFGVFSLNWVPGGLGPLLTLGAQTVFLGLVLPCVEPRRRGFFWAWLAVYLAVKLSNVGVHYLGNDYYQVWLAVAVCLAVLVPCSVGRRRRR